MRRKQSQSPAEPTDHSNLIHRICGLGCNEDIRENGSNEGPLFGRIRLDDHRIYMSDVTQHLDPFDLIQHRAPRAFSASYALVAIHTNKQSVDLTRSPFQILQMAQVQEIEGSHREADGEAGLSPILQNRL